MKRLLATVIIAGLAGSWVSQARAEAFYCGDQIIDIGAYEYDVLRLCGKPTFVDGATWTYDFGEGHLLNVLFFEDGRVSYIEQRPRPQDQ